MLITNTKERYGIISILLHWIMAIMIILLIIMGIYMVSISISPLKLKLFRWHKEMGMLILMLATVRIGWRFFNTTPSLKFLPVLEQIAARGVHWVFYFFMFLLPISGWLLSSAAGLSVSFYGLFLFPDWISPNEIERLFLTSLHKWLAYALILMLSLHILASLKHFFINKDKILQRMLWP